MKIVVKLTKLNFEIMSEIIVIQPFVLQCSVAVIMAASSTVPQGG